MKQQWTTIQAAEAWGVSVRTAQRYFRVLGRRGTVPAGTARPKLPKGNPAFHSSDYQRGVAEKRWAGHINARDRRLIRYMIEEAREERRAKRQAELDAQDARDANDPDCIPYPEEDLPTEYEQHPPHYMWPGDREHHEAALKHKRSRPVRVWGEAR